MPLLLEDMITPLPPLLASDLISVQKLSTYWNIDVSAGVGAPLLNGHTIPGRQMVKMALTQQLH